MTTEQPDGVEPQAGGSITIGQATPLTGLDPTLAVAYGCCGGVELAAIYDTLVRFDLETQEYEPAIADSLEPNRDHSVWTLRLPAGLKFPDGAPFDAAAVKFNLERHIQQPRSLFRPVIMSNIASMDVVDDQTLTFTLTKGWAGFPYLLASGPGMIASPTAVAKGDAFNLGPTDAGVGPFKVETFRPGETLVLTRNPAYHGDQPPYLDEIRFTFIVGSDASYEALKAGTLDAFQTLSAPSVVASAEAAGYPVVEIPAIGGGLLIMNSGDVPCRGGAPAPLCAGKPDGTIVQLDVPTKDVRVRKAIRAAINPDVMNERFWGGDGEPHSSLFPDAFPWKPDNDAPQFDVDEAKKLVAEAKADGWDGKLRVLGTNSPSGRDMTTALATMLQAVGIDVQVSNDKDPGALTLQVIVQRDFDVAAGGLGLDDVFDTYYAQLPANMSTSEYRYGYGSPEMDAAIGRFREAVTDTERRDAVEGFVDVWQEDAPFAVFGTVRNAMVSGKDVHGFTRGTTQLVYLDKVWTAQD